jgi:HPr kinase/phosphorylase
MTGDVPIHATCVAIDGHGVLIKGSSGSGKSSLALQLMAFGAALISDDRTQLSVGSQGLTVTAPSSLAGLIEVRGIGVLNADTQDFVRVCCVIDMDIIETARIPVERKITILGVECALLHKVEGLHFAAGVLQYVRGGRSDR